MPGPKQHPPASESIFSKTGVGNFVQGKRRLPGRGGTGGAAHTHCPHRAPSLDALRGQAAQLQNRSHLLIAESNEHKGMQVIQWQHLINTE